MKVWYPAALEQLIQGGVNLNSGTVKVAAVNASYTYDATHDFYNDVSADVEGTPQTLGSKTYTGGVFGAADVSYPGVTSGHVVKGLVVYIDTGTPSTSKLVCFINENADTTPISVTSSGANIPLSWASGVVAKLLG